jgi:transcriptional regulator with AAA-type ATPase domain
LFGHERGAFTGAQHSRPGLFETSDKGILLLDKVQHISYLSGEAAGRLLLSGVDSRVRSSRIHSVHEVNLTGTV